MAIAFIERWTWTLLEGVGGKRPPSVPCGRCPQWVGFSTPTKTWRGKSSNKACVRTQTSCKRTLVCTLASFIAGCPRDWGNLPIPNGPLTVGIDGGYVKAQGSEQDWFEVIAGKSILAFRRGEEIAEPSTKCFAFVQTYDQKPKRRLFELLQSQGLQMNQQIELLSDGGETVRDLQLYLSPEAEHLLDWFHIVRQEVVCVIVRHGTSRDRT